MAFKFENVPTERLTLVLRILTEQGVDLFFLWRWTLAVTGAVYTLVRAVQSIGRWLDWLEPTDRMNRIKRHYIMVHLLRLRVRDFWWELLQIALLVILLILVIYWH